MEGGSDRYEMCQISRVGRRRGWEIGAGARGEAEREAEADEREGGRERGAGAGAHLQMGEKPVSAVASPPPRQAAMVITHQGRRREV